MEVRVAEGEGVALVGVVILVDGIGVVGVEEETVAHAFADAEGHTAVERFVLFINRGFLITPTVLIDRGKYKTVLVRPNEDDLESALASISYFLVS